MSVLFTLKKSLKNILGWVTSKIHRCKYLLFTLLAVFMVSSGLEAQQQSQESTVVILLGPPGAGKGTQAGWLRGFLRLPHISTGDLLRANIREGSPLGKQAQAYIGQGKLVPDDLIFEILSKRIAMEDCRRGYILDGFPRTLDQANAYHERFAAPSHLFVFNLDLPEQSIIERLSQRLVCGECSAPFHLKNSPPKVASCCDYCGGALVRRSDDREEVIRSRLLSYREQTAPLIAHYSKTSNLYTISCTQSTQDVQSQIIQCLSKKIARP